MKKLSITKPGSACLGHISPQNQKKWYFSYFVCILGPYINIYNPGQKIIIKKNGKVKMAKHLAFNDFNHNELVRKLSRIKEMHS